MSFTTEQLSFLSVSLGAGAISIVFTTFAIPETVKEYFAPMLILMGSITSLLLISSSIFFIFQITVLSMYCFVFGTGLLLMPVLYIFLRIFIVGIFLR